MSLLDIWKTSPEEFAIKHVQQIISFAGDGKLKDSNETSQEFRSYLDQIPSSQLSRYASECLETKFENSGLVLQDIVNQAGRRLGFDVQDGLYRGRKGRIGHDGLWIYPDNDQIVVEVKTTDAYRIDLENLAGYRQDLIKSGEIIEEKSSILIVVGRQDTGDLEAQIRGSRHAWDIRILSISSLFRLMMIREEIEGPSVARKICDILIPREYTRVDEIINLVFETTAEVKDELPEAEVSQAEVPEIITVKEKKSKFTPVGFHEDCVPQIQNKLKISFLRRSKATFYSADKSTALICMVSREHDTTSGVGYWFAFHTHQSETLDTFPAAYMAFGCGSPESILLIPFKTFKQWLGNMNMTKNETREYWHIQIIKKNGKFILLQKAKIKRVDLTEFKL